MRFLLVTILASLFVCPAYAQMMPTKKNKVRLVEPGLEKAVYWKWKVEPSDKKDWGLPIEEATGLPSAPANGTTYANSTFPAPQALANTSNTYEVKRGDALIIIARKFKMTVDQLKVFNGLTNNKIIVGQVLKIPTPVEIAMLPKAPAPAPLPQKHKKDKVAADSQAPKANPENDMERENVALQIFLDRQQFSVGPIKGKPDAALVLILQRYQSVHEELKDIETLKKKIQETVGGALFTAYELKPEDFRFISPPKAEKVTKTAEPTKGAHGKKHKVSPPAPKTPSHLYDDMVTSSMLAYRSPWEFVAERFHCDVAYLHSLNPRLALVPAEGAKFVVPNVVPFEIEVVFNAPLQPAVDPKNPMRAAVVDLSMLEIYNGDKLVAMMPMYPARPGLRGKGTWTILDAIPRPRLETIQESRNQSGNARPVGLPSYLDAQPQAATPPPVQHPTLSSPQYLAAGPRNPVGIIWINLSKEKSQEILPYGLHGSSMPSMMVNHESLGGLRLTNWDIAHAAHLLPPGTPLEWK
ncbi:MAG: LysM peptidoglycan-binding domain-containing protein [Chthoniobacterales bacterium]